MLDLQLTSIVSFKKQLIYSVIMMICICHQNAYFQFSSFPIFGFLEIFSSKNLPITIWKCLAKREIKHNAQSQDKIDLLGGRDVLAGQEKKKINIFPSFQNKIRLDCVGPIDQLLKVWTGVNWIAGNVSQNIKVETADD